MDGGRHSGGPDPAERREPLPGLAGLPAHLVGGLPPPVRRVLAALAVLLALVAGAGALVVIPASREDARRLEAEERARQEGARRDRVRLAAVAARSHAGALPGGPAGGRTVAGRRRAVRMLEAAMYRDARSRVRRGLLAGPIIRARCSPFPASARPSPPEEDLGRAQGRYDCLAATRDFGATDGTEAGSLGHPYRALVDFEVGRYAFCKVTMRPGEGGLTRRSVSAVPRACGGADAGSGRR